MCLPESIRIPADWESHSCCVMAWAVHREWGGYAKYVKRELSDVISVLAEYEPIKLLTPVDQIADARAQVFGSNVEIIAAPVDDIWMRDIAPTFVRLNNELAAIDWNFNGWGATSARLSRPGDRLAGFISTLFNVKRISVPFIAEGGAFSTDGDQTLITTKSCLLNVNRNPRSGQNDQERMSSIESGFSSLGIEKVIWLKGDPTEPVTSGHVDGYVLINEPGSVLIEGACDIAQSLSGRKADLMTLRRQLDARGRAFQITPLMPPRHQYLEFSGSDFAASYLNAYVTDGAVVTAKFGDPERDEAARRTLSISFPGKDVRMLSINHIALGGGGIRCLTQPMPTVEDANV